jgi:hypothetical protein
MDSSTLNILSTANEYNFRPANVAPSLTAYTSGWAAANPWGTGALPGTSGRQCSNATTGALPIPSATSEGSKLRITRSKCGAAGNGISYCIYDRLVDYSGFLATDTSLNALTAVSLPRFTSGAGVFFFLEVYTTGASAVATTCTVSYTNQAGVSGRTATVALPTNWLAATRAYVPVLQSGDTGVRSIQSSQLAGASPNAGNYGFTLFGPLTGASSLRVTSAGLGTAYRDLTQTLCVPFDTTSCLSYWIAANSTAVGAPELSYSVV